MRTRTAAVLLAAAALAAGCSSGSSHDDKATAAPTSTAVATPATTSASPTADGRAALTDAVRAYSAAYFKPDVTTAATLLSSRCRQQTSVTAFRSSLTRAVAMYGHQQIKAVTVDRLSAPLALVSYTYSVPVLDQHGQPWVLEDGAWKYDAC